MPLGQKTPPGPSLFPGGNYKNILPTCAGFYSEAPVSYFLSGGKLTSSFVPVQGLGTGPGLLGDGGNLEVSRPRESGIPNTVNFIL